MTGPMRLNAFTMNCVGHQSQGLWRHPRDQSMDYTSIGHWVELARTLERGCFDTVFLADVLGIYDVYGGGPDAALRTATQVPVNDPMLVVPVMAAVTEHLGFSVTGNTSFEPPYTFARRMSTLDHLTGGRVSWNIVTGYLDSAARAMGSSAQDAHDVRYQMAAEYLEVVYRLWEGSWEDGAVVRDRERGVFTDPAKVHRVAYAGAHHRVDGIHLSEPSPQRTPVLFQAGSSRPGQRFAAANAECVFVAGNDPVATATEVARLREEIAAAGRDPADVVVCSMISVIVAETEAAAHDKAREYASYASAEGALALLSGWSGKDYARPLDADASSEAIASAARAQPRDIDAAASHVALAGSGPLIVGSPDHVADELERVREESGVDGFSLTRQVVPETFVDFVDLVVPELQRRGALKREYSPGTLREKLFGGQAHLQPPHPAATHRPRPAAPATRHAADAPRQRQALPKRSR